MSIKRLFTVPEIIAQFESGEYSSELLLQHAMAHLKDERRKSREQFAGMAVQGLIASGPHDCALSAIARDAIIYADALLAELARTEPAEHHFVDANKMIGLLRPDSEGFWWELRKNGVWKFGEAKVMTWEDGEESVRTLCLTVGGVYMRCDQINTPDRGERYFRAIPPTTEKSSLPPDADGWIVRIPTDPIPEKHNGVRFGDGEEELSPNFPWVTRRWRHVYSSYPADHITHYRP